MDRKYIKAIEAGLHQMQESKNCTGKKKTEEVMEKVDEAVVDTNEDADVQISEVIELLNDFIIEDIGTYSFADYIDAAKVLMVEEDVVKAADWAFRSNNTNFIIEAFTHLEIMDRVDNHKKAGHRVSTPVIGTKGGQPYAEYTVTDKEGVSRRYIHHGNVRKVENLGTSSRDK